MTTTAHLTFGIVLPDDSLGVLFDPSVVVAQHTGSNLRMEGRSALSNAADPAYSVESGQGQSTSPRRQEPARSTERAGYFLLSERQRFVFVLVHVE